MPVDPRDRINKAEAIRKHLERYGHIDKPTAYAKYKTMSLPQYVEKLRKRGMRITTVKDLKGTYYEYTRD